jgi:hypothetical protein
MEIKQFTLIIAKDDAGNDTLSTSGNMTLNDVANALITLAYSQGKQDEKQTGAEKQTAPSA